MSRPMTARDWAMLLTLATVWGGSFFFNGVAVRELPVLTVVVARVGLAAVILLCVLRATGLALPREARIWRALFVMGLMNNAVPFGLIVWGQGHIASGLAAILNATTPLFTVLLAHGLTADERLSPGKAAGVALGFAGVVTMIGAEVLHGLGTGVMAQIACLGAALSYALAGLYGRRFRAMGVPPLVTAAGQAMAATVLLGPLMLAVDRPWTLPLPSPATLAALAGLASLSTAFAYWLYFRLLAAAGATNLLLVTFLVPVSAILLGVLVLGETLLPKHGLGMALIGFGLAMIDGRLPRALAGAVSARAANPNGDP